MSAQPRREVRKAAIRARILDAALVVFSRAGFSAARMDEIAVEAGVSKPTLYHHFDNKQSLFTEMLLVPRDTMLLAFEDTGAGDTVGALWRFAWAYADTVLRADYLSLARLVIGEAQRFPDIGRAYQASGPDRVLSGLMEFMAAQAAAGALYVDDAELAAEDFWGLILSAPRNRALHVPDAVPDRKSVARSVENGMRVFLRAYATDPKAAVSRLDALVAEGPPRTGRD